MLGGRDSSLTTWGCPRWSSAASSIVTMRSPRVDEGGQGVQQRRLARTRAATDQDAAAGADHRLRSRPKVARSSVPSPTRSSGPGGTRESADRNRRTVDCQWRDHHVDPRAVGQPRVGHRTEFIDSPAQRREDALDRIAELLFVFESQTVDPFHPARPLDVDPIAAVDHHLFDRLVLDQDLEWAETRGLARCARPAARGRPRDSTGAASSTAAPDRGIDILAVAGIRRGGSRPASAWISTASRSQRVAPIAAPGLHLRRARDHGQAPGEGLGVDQIDRLAPGQAEDHRAESRRPRRPDRLLRPAINGTRLCRQAGRPRAADRPSRVTSTSTVPAHPSRESAVVPDTFSSTGIRPSADPGLAGRVSTLGPSEDPTGRHDSCPRASGATVSKPIAPCRDRPERAGRHEPGRNLPDLGLPRGSGRR